MKEVFSIRQFGILMLGLTICSGSCSFIKSQLPRHYEKSEVPIAGKKVPPSVSPQKEIKKRDSLRHWFVAISKEKPIRIRNKHNTWFNREQDFKVVPVASISNTLPSHPAQIIDEGAPARPRGFGIGGFVLAFLSWLPVVGVIAIVFGAIGVSRDRATQGQRLD